MVYDILITGGAGYLGSTMVPDMLDAGHKVTVLDNFIFRQTSLNHICHHPNFSVVKGDIRVASVMVPLMNKADVIIPLAAARSSALQSGCCWCHYGQSRRHFHDAETSLQGADRSHAYDQ